MPGPAAPGKLSSLLATSTRRLGRPNPTISVVIPVFNKWPVTARCLEALLLCDRDIDIQVVVVDDASTDETPVRLAQLAGIEVVRNGRNLGFVHSSNRGASLAYGTFILFLNNDTEVFDGALAALVARMAADDRIGIVGSKLLYPDGRLQEAGNIIWADATGWNYGRLDRPGKAEYNFARDVDYVSGASLLVRTRLFRQLGGFDERYSPGYYEDADLCFGARALGQRVVYEPASVVLHHEGITSGTDLAVGMKRFQGINRQKFASRWADELSRSHLESNSNNVARAARLRIAAKRTILVIDSYVPLYDCDAGSSRIKRLMDGFTAAGYRVIFYPDNLLATAGYTQALQQGGIEVVYSTDNDERTWQDYFAGALAQADAVWVSRPDLCRKYLPLVRARSQTPILYDTIDLHHLRLRRQAEHDQTIDEYTWRAVERLELACASAADGTIVVSDYEFAMLAAAGIPNVSIVPTIHDPEPKRTHGFAGTSGILFIGGYAHPPNIDAVRWLVREIMPLVWRALPTTIVTLLGSGPPAAVRELAGERVLVPGYIRDVGPYFETARMFVAPLRYGAGVKGKIGHALGYGVPIVTTSVGAEGFNLLDRRHALVADDAAAFASAMLELFHDAGLWTRLAEAAAEALAPFTSLRVTADAIAAVENVVTNARSAS